MSSSPGGMLPTHLHVGIVETSPSRVVLSLPLFRGFAFRAGAGRPLCLPDRGRGVLSPLMWATLAILGLHMPYVRCLDAFFVL